MARNHAHKLVLSAQCGDVRQFASVRCRASTGTNRQSGRCGEDTEQHEACGGGPHPFVRRIKGRRYELFYNGPRLHMVVLRTPDASYWVVNTLLDRLSNETMLAIASSGKGMDRPTSIVLT